MSYTSYQHSNYVEEAAECCFITPTQKLEVFRALQNVYLNIAIKVRVHSETIIKIWNCQKSKVGTDE